MRPGKIKGLPVLFGQPPRNAPAIPNSNMPKTKRRLIKVYGGASFRRYHDCELPEKEKRGGKNG
jgi:hypothetical protein